MAKIGHRSCSQTELIDQSKCVMVYPLSMHIETARVRSGGTILVCTLCLYRYLA